MDTNNAVSQPQIKGRSRPFRSLLFAVAGALILTGFIVPRANAVLVTYFNFEDSTLGAAFDPNSDQPPGAQSSTLTVAFAGAAPISVGGIALNVAPGDLDPNLLGMGFHDTKAGTADITFSVSTLSLTNFALSFAVRDVGNGFTLATGSYSLDGVTFTTTGVSGPVAIASTSSAVVTFTFPTAVDNQASPVFFRFSLSGGKSNGVDLQSVVDNIQLNAAPEPATVAGGLLGACGLCWHQRRRLIRFLRLRPA